MSRFERVRELHGIALEMSEEERAAFLDKECAEDDGLRAEVESLLETRSAMGDFLSSSAPEILVDLAAGQLEPGAQLGGYEIVTTIASGGGGTVYEALQANPRRRVALKVMHLDVGPASSAHRFREEAEILARLQHPGIATIFEAGLHEEGTGARPWFAMEFVESARTLTHFCDAEDLSRARRMELMADVCDAVHHGHTKGIVHRDLKPGNLLVDAAGRPKVIDFGIALRQGTSGALAGTLTYMSPEQCEGRDVDIRADVYSLGVVLYELLSGRPPHELDDVSIGEGARRIREELPAPLPASLRGDVEAITLKAMAKDPEARYASASALADDIRRHLEHRPVEARSAGVLYQAGRFARRHRVACTAVALVVLISVGAAITNRLLAVESQQAREEAEFEAYVANVAAAAAAMRMNDVAAARQQLLRTEPRFRDWEWRHLWSRLDRSEETLPCGDRVFAGAVGGGWIAASSATRFRVWNDAHQELVREALSDPVYQALAFSPDRRWLAFGTEGGNVELRVAATGALQAVLSGHEDSVLAIAFQPGTDVLASASRDRTIKLWRVADGILLRTLTGHADRVVTLSFDAAGKQLASGGREGMVRIWDPSSGKTTRAWRAHEGSVEGVAFRPDGARLVSCSRDRTVRWWDPSDGRLLALGTGHQGNIRAVAYSPSGETVATASYDNTLRLWNEEGRTVAVLRGHTGNVRGVHFLDDERIVSFSPDGTVRLWRNRPGADVPILRGHGEVVTALAFAPDGRLLASGGLDGSVLLWDVAAEKAVTSLERQTSEIEALRFIAEDRLRTWTHDGWMRDWLVPDGVIVAEKKGVPSTVIRSQDGTLHLQQDGTRFMIRDAAHATLRHTLEVGALGVAAFAPDGTRIATGGSDGMLRLWDVERGREVLALRADEARVRCLAFSPDGRILATGGEEWEGLTCLIKLWRTSEP